jgi:hypothetical protein
LIVSKIDNSIEMAMLDSFFKIKHNNPGYGHFANPIPGMFHLLEGSLPPCNKVNKRAKPAECTSVNMTISGITCD